jgi:hypothetical protein
MSVLNKPRVEAFIGGTGSGKGVSINRRLAEIGAARQLIWDPRNEYKAHGPEINSPVQLADVFARANGGPVKARFVPGGNLDIEKAFAFVCNLAFMDQKRFEARPNPPVLVFLAEELSDVTKPSWAPPNWRRCITQGRHVGLHLLAATQRPALIDKSFLSATTVVRCCMLGYDEDTKVMAKELRVDQSVVDELVTSEDENVNPTRTTINYVERVKRTREVFLGQIVIQGSKFKETRTLIDRAGKPISSGLKATVKRGAT